MYLPAHSTLTHWTDWVYCHLCRSLLLSLFSGNGKKRRQERDTKIWTKFSFLLLKFVRCLRTHGAHVRVCVCARAYTDVLIILIPLSPSLSPFQSVVPISRRFGSGSVGIWLNYNLWQVDVHTTHRTTMCSVRATHKHKEKKKLKEENSRQKSLFICPVRQLTYSFHSKCLCSFPGLRLLLSILCSTFIYAMRVRVRVCVHHGAP